MQMTRYYIDQWILQTYTLVSRISLNLLAISATARDAGEHSMHKCPIYWLVRQLQRQSRLEFRQKGVCYLLRRDTRHYNALNTQYSCCIFNRIHLELSQARCYSANPCHFTQRSRKVRNVGSYTLKDSAPHPRSESSATPLWAPEI